MAEHRRGIGLVRRTVGRRAAALRFVLAPSDWSNPPLEKLLESAGVTSSDATGRKFNSVSRRVTGEVVHSGLEVPVVSAAATRNVVDGIRDAGGLLPMADTRNVRLRSKRASGAADARNVDIDAYLRGTLAFNDVPILRANDTLEVPELLPP